MNKFIFYLALTCWLLSVWICTLSFTGINANDIVPHITLGLSVVTISIFVFSLYVNQSFFDEFRNKKTNSFSDVFPDGTPKWLLYFAAISVSFSVILFSIARSQELGTAVFKEGKYILENGPRFVRELTEKEYLKMHAMQALIPTGHLIWLSSFAMGILFKRR